MSQEPPVYALLRTLVSIRSTTLAESAACSALGAHLQSLGWTVHEQRIPSSSPARHNLYAFRGGSPEHPRRKVKVLLNSHVDTVPPHIELSEDEDNFYGRGTCDAKGSVAAQICAVTELLEEGVVRDEDVGLLYVVGEETDHIGMKVADELALSTSYLLVGEPTEMQLAKGHKGMIKADIVVKGVAGHSGYPERGKSANAHLVEILHELQNTTWPTSDRLGDTTFNIGIIQGGVAANVIPADARADISFRVSTSTAEVQDQLQRIVERKRPGHDCEVELIVRGALDPVPCVTVDVGVPTFVARYFTDIPYLHGPQKALLFGPGSITVAHATNEFVPKKELVEAVAVIKNIIKKLLVDDVVE
ncbi:hypothetical protein PhCBS80983_g00425 [Powellomyces hirtus]|uniref:Peptidase M20 dimerisation domain-containing protein n=1 Tax=Powellomyces hirtus TaxID=109895 RepID=A0A507EGK4_9FUNG|nr:hypothetical protein PhCBS80983_g00425 [Powellomyces hirtus]